MPKGLDHDSLPAYESTTVYCCVCTPDQHECLIVSHRRRRSKCFILLYRKDRITVYRRLFSMKQACKGLVTTVSQKQKVFQFHCLFIATLAGNVGLPGVRLQAWGGKLRGEQFTVRDPLQFVLEFVSRYLPISFSFCVPFSWIVSFQSVWDIALMLKFSSYQYVVGESGHCVASFRHCLLGFATRGSCVGLMALSAVVSSADPCVLPLSPCLFSQFFSLNSTLETPSPLPVTIQLQGLVERSER